MPEKPSRPEGPSTDRPFPRELQEKGADVVQMPVREPTNQVRPQNTGTTDPDVD